MAQSQDNPNINKANDTRASSSTLAPGTGILGLQAAILIVICFVLIGYSIPLSLFLGAVAGVSIAALSNWWKLDNQTEYDLQVSFTDAEIYGLRKRNRRLRQKRYLETRNQYRSRRNRSSLTGLFFQTGVASLAPPEREQPQSGDDKNGDNREKGENE